MKASYYTKLLKDNSYLSIFLFTLIVWFLIFLTSGSLLSGYHFTDDHEIVHIHHNFVVQKLNINEVFSQWINTDYSTGRFRPFYYIHRILVTKFLGMNFGLWSVYNGLLAVSTTFLFFIFATLLKFPATEAVIFAFLTTLGTQSAIWWQLGPAETIGTFLLSAALVFAVLSEVSTRNKTFYKVLLVLCVLLMSLSKESFILIIPAICFIKLWVSCETNSLSWRQAVGKNKVLLSVLWTIFCVEVLIVKFYIGLTPDIGYAGVEEFSIQKILGTVKSLSQAGSWWVVLAGLTGLILTSRHPLPQSIVNVLKALRFPFIVFLLVAVPQILLYAKSGISQRYLLPGILSYTFLIINLYRYLKRNYHAVTKLILLLIMVSLCFRLSTAWEAAYVFGREGRATHTLLETVEANTTTGSKVLIVTNSMIYSEWNLSVKKYLEYVLKRTDLHFAVYGNKTSAFYKKLEKFYEFKTLERIKDRTKIQCILTFPEMNNIFLKTLQAGL